MASEAFKGYLKSIINAGAIAEEDIKELANDYLGYSSFASRYYPE
ncbi:hypothetical protein [Veillonella montpellierensis]|nr:hypothetical protein [Veillonella montpellierensis]